MNSITIKKCLSRLLFIMGIHRIFTRRILHDKAFVLTYHRILPALKTKPYVVQPGMFVSVSSFERHVKYLKENFDIVHVDELVSMVAEGRDVGRRCAITFDDGWQDNFKYAFPILKKYNVPATIFLATSYVGTNKVFWPEELSYFLTSFSTHELMSDVQQASLVNYLNSLDFTANGEQLVDSAIMKMKAILPAIRDDILRSFRNRLGSAAIDREILNWEEIKEMHESGLVRFGSHTANHVILDQVEHGSAKDEIVTSCSEIRKHLGVVATSFAYPNGNYNESIVDILKESNISIGLTTKKGYVQRLTSALEIPRIGIHEDISNTIPMLTSRLLFRGF